MWQCGIVACGGNEWRNVACGVWRCGYVAICGNGHGEAVAGGSDMWHVASANMWQCGVAAAAISNVAWKLCNVWHVACSVFNVALSQCGHRRTYMANGQRLQPVDVAV
jgi:hypothetical protein